MHWVGANWPMVTNKILQKVRHILEYLCRAGQERTNATATPTNTNSTTTCKAHACMHRPSIIYRYLEGKCII